MPATGFTRTLAVTRIFPETDNPIRNRMLEVSTLYLLLTMFGFVLLGIVVVHHHNCSDMIRRKRNEVRRLTVHLEAKNSVLDEQIADLKIQVEELDEKLSILEQRQQP